ncbi:hypothetical protein [Azospirillum sp. ST 5-10]|uniref:hypothetical protein n=1 Tax=unclassified Azospirillum TaxID=2630922 RepID=UPI003F4A451C
MPASIQEQVIAAVETKLGTVVAPNVPGTITVFRGRRKEVPEGKRPALAFRVTGGNPPSEQLAAGVVRNLLVVRIEGLTDDTSDTGLDRLLTDLAAAVQAAFETDWTLGGLAVDCTPIAMDRDAADDEGIGGVGAILAEYLVEFWTKPGDPYALAP